MIRHVLDHVVADDEIEITVRQSALNLHITADEHPVHPPTGDAGGRRMPFDAPAFAARIEAGRETAFAATYLQHRAIVPGQELRHLGTLAGVIPFAPHAGHSGLSKPLLAIATARKMARALFRVSFHSLTGTESATMPAPAWI